MTDSNRRSDPPLIVKLQQHFSDDAIIELTALIAYQNLSSKFNAALASGAGVLHHASSGREPHMNESEPVQAHAGTGSIRSQSPKNPPCGNQIHLPDAPEIVRDAPGDCPLCGMALVPIAGTGGGEAGDSELRDLARRLWVGVALSIPLVVLAMSR